MAGWVLAALLLTAQVLAASSQVSVGRTTSYYIGDPGPDPRGGEPLHILGFFTIQGHWRKSCGKVDPEYGFQTFLGFQFALERLREDPRFRGMSLNGVVIDTCNINFRVTHDLYELLYEEGFVYVDSQSGFNKTLTVDNIVAIFTISSDNSFPAVEILAPRHIMTISPSATSSLLNGRAFLLRNPPPSNLQGPVLRNILLQFNWTYVGVILTDHDFGHGIYEMLAEGSGHHLCIARKYVLPGNASAEAVGGVVRELASLRGLRTVVLLTGDPHTRLVLQAAADQGLAGHFTWVSTVWWANEQHLVQGLHTVARGAITLQIWSETSHEFMSYIKGLTLENHGNIPKQWFEEFWQQSLGCRLDKGYAMQEYNTPCQPNMTLNPDVITQNAFALHSIIATQMVGEGLTHLHNCDTQNGNFSTCFKQAENVHQQVFQATSQASWTPHPADFNGTFQYNKEGFGNKGFHILNLQRHDDGSYAYVEIGTGATDTPATIRMEQFRSYRADGTQMTSIPVSHCPSASGCSCENPNLTGVSHHSSFSYTVLIMGISLFTLNHFCKLQT